MQFSQHFQENLTLKTTCQSQEERTYTNPVNSVNQKQANEATLAVIIHFSITHYRKRKKNSNDAGEVHAV